MFDPYKSSERWLFVYIPVLRMGESVFREGRSFAQAHPTFRRSALVSSLREPNSFGCQPLALNKCFGE